MTGLRLGYAATKIPGFIDKFLTFAINFWTNLPMPCMKAAEAALGVDQSEAQREVADYKKKRDVIVRDLNKIDGIRCHNPIGSFYLFPNVTRVCKRLKLKDAEDLRRYLLTYDKKNKKGVAVLARKHFGRRLLSEKEEYIRISIAGTMESLIEGVKRIKEAVEK
jgi:aspartate aminotransferase